MSLIYTNPPCPSCHLQDTELVAKRRFCCNNCGTHFTPLEPSEEELKLAIRLNNTRRTYHQYVGSLEGFQAMRLEITTKLDKLTQDLVTLRDHHLLADETVSQCDNNQRDLESQLAILIKRRKDKECEVEERRMRRKNLTPAPITVDKATKPLASAALKTALEEMQRVFEQAKLSLVTTPTQSQNSNNN